MKLGISALLFNLKDALEICENEKQITHIEIGIDNLDECDILMNYKEEIIQLGLTIGIHLPMELNTCENISYIRNSWISFINIIDERLKELDIKYFNLHLGYAMSNRLVRNRQKYLNNSVNFFNSKDLHENIILTIENTYSNDGDFSNIGNTAKDFEYIFNNTNINNLYFCYDTGHYLINKDDYLTSLNEKTKVVHLSDNNGIEDSHIGIGKGILDSSQIKAILKMNIDYLVLEINYEDIHDTLIKLISF